MKPPAAAVAAPQQESVHTSAGVAAPQSTAIGAPIARTQIFPRPEFPSPAAATDTLTLDAPADTGPLVSRPPAPEPVANRTDHPDRAFAVGQVVCWQLAVVAVGVSTTGSRAAIIITSVAALSLVLLTAIRIRGMWLYRWAGVALLFAIRRRGLDLGTDAGLDLVGLFCDRTTTGAVIVRDHPHGTLCRPDGASVALRVDADSRFELLSRLPSLAEAADEQPVPVTIQLVLHSGVRQNQPARAWIAIRATRTPEICTDEQLGQVLANTVRRLVRRFDREKVESLPLDRADLPASIAALAHANAGRGQLRERWSRWAAGPVQQATVRLTGTSSLPPATVSALAATLLGTTTGAAQTLTVAVTTTPRPQFPEPGHRLDEHPTDTAGARTAGADPAADRYGSAVPGLGDAGHGSGRTTASTGAGADAAAHRPGAAADSAGRVVRHEAVVRVAASHPATLDTALTVLTTLAKSFGTEPDRLDGRHTSGVAATLPLGVPVS